MEIKKGITDPARGERLLNVYPELAPDVDVEWQRRLNLFQNRALSDTALTAEQLNRAVRINLSGRTLSAGILNGLEVALENEPSAGSIPHTTYRINAGFGLTALGETLSLSREMQVDTPDVRVVAPSSILAGGEIASGSRRLLPREVSNQSFNQLIASGITLPRAGILLLQPVYVETARGVDPTDPCVNDPEADAFNDLQKVDGVRLLWYAWPTEWMPLPIHDGRWRNRMAYAIFHAEASLHGHDMMPWEAFGVPIGVVGHDEDFVPLFVDGAAVRRAAGKPKRRTSLLPNKGNPFLWQARMEQLAEQLIEGFAEGLTRTQVVAQLRALPPAGLLPAEFFNVSFDDAFDNRVWSQGFFPPYHHLTAVPIPLEQLDVVLEASASLQPLDMFNAERVRLLVPVPQSVYDPELLQVKTVDPEFQDTISRFVTERTKWITRREIVRQVLNAHINALSGEPVEFPTPEPNALDDEYDDEEKPILVEDRASIVEEGILNFFEADTQEKFGISIELEGDDRIVPTLAEIEVQAIEELKAFLIGKTPLNPVRPIYLKKEIENFTIPTELTDKLRYTTFGTENKIVRLDFVGKFREQDKQNFNDLYGRFPDLQTEVPEDKKDSILKRATTIQLDKLDELGLEGFVDYLESLINRADDKVDLGFALARTDIYRVRQLVLGTTEASKLATSPTLASIAKGDTAVATKQEISKFIEDLKLVDKDGQSGAMAAGPESLSIDAAAADVTPGASFLPGSFTFPANPGTPDLFVPGLIPGATIGFRPTFPTVPSIVGDSSAAAIAGIKFDENIKAALERDTILGQVDSGATIRDALKEGIPDIGHVIGQTAIVGKQNQIRNVTVGERLSAPPALESKNNASASIYDTVSSFDSLEIHTDDLEVAGQLIITEEGDEKVKKRSNFTLLDLQFQAGGFGTLLNEQDNTEDEGRLFSSAVDIVDRHVAFLRQIEGRVQAYRQALEKCRETMLKLRRFISMSDNELKNIEDHVAETRHDVAVSRALLTEEQERVNEINLHRDEIIQNHVKFYAFVRPRLSTLANLNKYAVADLNPALVESPLPACFADDIEPPDELLEMVDLWRDVPLNWLKYVRKSIQLIDRPGRLKNAYLTAQTRAKGQISTRVQKQISNNATRLGSSIQQIFNKRQQVVFDNRVVLASTKHETFVQNPSWQANMKAVESFVSIGDILNAPFGRQRINQQLTRELEKIADIATCLYTHFSDVKPILRLDWAERLSQFDDAVHLRNLATLPSWEEVEYIERRQMQALVDWLYGRINATISDAQALMDDVIRVCILLASHAPVDQITAGSVEEKVIVRPGELIKLAIDPNKVRIGHKVLLFDKQAVIGQAVIQNLEATFAAAEIVQAALPDFELQKGARVQIGGSSALKRNPITRQSERRIGII